MGLEGYATVANQLWSKILGTPDIVKSFTTTQLLALSVGGMPDSSSKQQIYRVSIGQFSNLNPSAPRNEGHLVEDYNLRCRLQNQDRGYLLIPPQFTLQTLDSLADLELASLGEDSKRFFLILNGTIRKEAVLPTILTWDTERNTVIYKEPDLTPQPIFLKPALSLLKQRLEWGNRPIPIK